MIINPIKDTNKTAVLNISCALVFASLLNNINPKIKEITKKLSNVFKGVGIVLFIISFLFYN